MLAWDPGEVTASCRILLQHFRGNLDNWDPALVDALAARLGDGCDRRRRCAGDHPAGIRLRFFAPSDTSREAVKEAP